MSLAAVDHIAVDRDALAGRDAHAVMPGTISPIGTWIAVPSRVDAPWRRRADSDSSRAAAERAHARASRWSR